MVYYIERISNRFWIMTLSLQCIVIYNGVLWYTINYPISIVCWYDESVLKMFTAVAILSQSDQVSHNEELVPNLKEYFLQQLKQKVSSYTSQFSTGSSGIIRPSGNIGLIKRVSLLLIVIMLCVCGTCVCVCSMCVHMHVHVSRIKPGRLFFPSILDQPLNK